jgi:iron complex outermembrane receptor protein
MSERVSARPQPWRRLFVTTLLASTAVGPAYAASTAADAAAVDEIIVTATKRSENLQKVPISVQALSPKVLADHQVDSFDDYVKLMPSVSFQSSGPGQSQLYFRGIASAGDGLHSGSEPATGVYIDETPVTTIANNVDIHIYDIARVEALAGPQGTLFGASSLSGTLRIITNQPDPSKFSAGYDLQGDKFGKGDPGGVAEGFVNIPLGDKAAIRLVGFDEHDGGYIDNVFKSRTFTLNPGDGTIAENNAAYVKKNFNDVDTYGGRAALKIDLNDQWSVTPSVIYQHQLANGVFVYDPKRGDLAVSDFSPDSNLDRWYQAALTIRGKIADWDVLYSGGYFARSVDNHSDYSYYSVGYDKAGYTSLVDFPNGHGGFLDPDQRTTFFDQYTKEAHEFRINSPTADRLRMVAGFFYQRQTDQITANYFVPGLAATGNSAAVPDAGDDVFYTRLARIDRDKAVFSEFAFDILRDLTVNAGIRYFTVDNTLYGFSGLASNVLAPKPGEPCLSSAWTDIPCADVNKKATEYGETHKVNLTWRVDPHRMLYATLSTGFRPGGVNRLPGVAPYAPDTLTNYEIGWKTTWLDNRLRVNGAIFDEEWHGVQYALSLPPAGITSIFNAGDAVSRGFEGDASWRVGEHWTLSASGTAVDAQLTTTFCNLNPPGCAPKGTQLPIQPKLKANATARYDFYVRDYKSYVQGAAQTQGDTRSALLDNEEADLGPTKGFSTFDLSGGFGKDNWTAEAFVQNLFDRRGALSISTNCTITVCGGFARVYPTKPQFFGVKFGQKF